MRKVITRLLQTKHVDHLTCLVVLPVTCSPAKFKVHPVISCILCSWQTAYIYVSCIGVMIYTYSGDYDAFGHLGMTAETWAQYHSDRNCESPVGRATNLGSGPPFAEPSVTPYFGDWSDSSDNYQFSDPLPDPSPYERATDPYNQLAWFENNIWAFTSDSSLVAPPVPQRVPRDSRQYGPNTIAANVAATQDDGSMSQCSMLFNERSDVNRSVAGSVNGNMIVNTKQAIICEYPGNKMAVSVTVPVREVFGFRNGQLQFKLKAIPVWYPGDLAGIVNVTFINTGSMAQVVYINSSKTQCCMTSPSLDCSIFAFEFPQQVPLFVASNGSAVPSSVVQFRIVLPRLGEGYCSVFFNHFEFDGKVGRNTTSDVMGQFGFLAPPGPPIYFKVKFNVYLLGMERSNYILNDNFIPGATFNEIGDIETR